MDISIIQSLNKRYATKKFDPAKKLSEADLEAVLEAVRLTPTSYGLQLMKVVVVDDEAMRAKLLAHSYNQAQVVDASHLIVLCREAIVEDSHVEAYISNMAATRSIPEEKLEGFKKMMIGTLAGMSATEKEVWMDKQVYIALGNLLTACAVLEIDSCPMEGFDPKAYDAVLGLKARNLSSVLTIPIGYRSAEDANALNKKVRRSTADFIVRI